MTTTRIYEIIIPRQLKQNTKDRYKSPRTYSTRFYPCYFGVASRLVDSSTSPRWSNHANHERLSSGKTSKRCLSDYKTPFQMSQRHFELSLLTQFVQYYSIVKVLLLHDTDHGDILMERVVRIIYRPCPIDSPLGRRCSITRPIF
jgi:hypothetical protein